MKRKDLSQRLLASIKVATENHIELLLFQTLSQKLCLTKPELSQLTALLALKNFLNVSYGLAATYKLLSGNIKFHREFYLNMTLNMKEA